MTIKALCITEDVDRPTVETFIGLSKSDVQVTVICPAEARLRPLLSEAGIRLIDFTLRRRIDRAGVRALREELTTGAYDILHLFSNKALQNGLLAAKGMPIRIVAYRGIVGNVSFFSPISWMRFLNPRIDRIVCVADAVRDYFLRMQPAFLRLPEERLVRIYKGHSLDWYSDEPADLTTLGLPEDAFVVTSVANYRPRKGIESLVDALATLPSEWPVHLLLVGQMDAPKLDRRIEASPARDRIHRAGRRQDAQSLTAASDVFVLASIKREGLSRALIEAMAYARPTVVTNCGGSPELVIDGVSGLVVPAGDSAAIGAAIRKLYEDRDLGRRLGQAARERIDRHFRIEDTIEQTLALYRSLVRSG